MNRKMFVIILNWNNKKLTSKCLHSVFRTIGAHPFIEVIVVDNASKDGSISYLKKIYKKVIFIQNKDNLGYAGGNNVGIRYAMKHDADIVALLNNDVVVTPGFFKELLDVITMNPKIGIVGPKTYYQNKNKIIEDAGGKLSHRYFGINRGQSEKDTGKYNKISKVDYVSGSAMAIDTAVIKKIGLLDERFFLYYEDGDFCLRARKAGYKCVYVPNAVQYHIGGASTKMGSSLHEYYNVRNHLLFIEKNAPLKVRLREIFRLPKTVFEFVRANKKYALLGLRDYYLRRFGKRMYW